jgi:hypothetical protein
MRKKRTIRLPCLLLTGLGGITLVAIIAIGLAAQPLPGPVAIATDLPTATPTAPAPPPANPLEQQETALQPRFRAELNGLAQAPRYFIQASVDPGTGQVTGQMSVEYTYRGAQPLTELAFRLLPNAQAIYGGGSLTVENVTQKGRSLQTTLAQGRTVLRVSLPQPLQPGQMTALSIAFRAQVPAGSGQGYGIFSRSQESLSLAGWYPLLALYQDGWQTPPVPAVGDAMWAETSLYDVRLIVPSGYEVVSTGTAIERQDKAGQSTWHIVSGPAREFALAMSNRFEQRETQVDGVRLRLYTLPARAAATAPDEALKMMAAAFKAYVARFGPYPYTEFDLVEAAVGIGGYEFSGMVYVDYNRRVRGPFEPYRYLSAHEIAHQWWYNLVGNASVDEPWLDEALASYAAVLYLQYAGDAQGAARLLESWKADYGLRRPGDPPVDSSALLFSNWVAYRRTVYYHGALFLDELRQTLGDERFFALLQRLQTRYRYRMMTTGDFLREAEDIAGHDIAALWARWFR